MGRITKAQADAAMQDPAVPAADALRMFDRAYRRDNDITRGFMLATLGACRAKRMQDAPKGGEGA